MVNNGEDNDDSNDDSKDDSNGDNKDNCGDKGIYSSYQNQYHHHHQCYDSCCNKAFFQAPSFDYKALLETQASFEDKASLVDNTSLANNMYSYMGSKKFSHNTHHRDDGDDGYDENHRNFH